VEGNQVSLSTFRLPALPKPVLTPTNASSLIRCTPETSLAGSRGGGSCGTTTFCTLRSLRQEDDEEGPEREPLLGRWRRASGWTQHAPRAQPWASWPAPNFMAHTSPGIHIPATEEGCLQPQAQVARSFPAAPSQRLNENAGQH